MTNPANRMRRYRERKQAGIHLVTLEISAAGTEALVRLGWLGPDQTEDASAIGTAILRIAGFAVVKGLREPSPSK